MLFVVLDYDALALKMWMWNGHHDLMASKNKMKGRVLSLLFREYNDVKNVSLCCNWNMTHSSNSMRH